MRLRSAEELASPEAPAWPVVASLISDAPVDAVVLPPRDNEAGLLTLFRLQVTTGSTLGALAAHCGAILVDHGWLRLLGSGLDGLPGLAEANGLGEPSERSMPPGHLVVAHDVLGGTFAVNGGSLPGDRGEICYFGPDTLSWTPIGLPGHSALVRWALSGGPGEAFADLRWPGWEQQAAAAGPGQAISTYPPLWAAESRGSTVQRSIVPLSEAVASHDEFARQLGGIPDGQTVRVEIVDN
jgi:hypothetical protein